MKIYCSKMLLAVVSAKKIYIINIFHICTMRIFLLFVVVECQLLLHFFNAVYVEFASAIQ